MNVRAIAVTVAVLLMGLIWAFPVVADEMHQHGHEAMMQEQKAGAAMQTESATTTETVLRYSNKTCPITGKPINPKVFYEYKDKEGKTYGRIYVCCPACLSSIAENAQKYYNKAYAQQKKAASKAMASQDIANLTCPVMGGKAKADIAIEYNGKKVNFCCPACVGKFTAEPGKYLKKLAEQETPKEQ